MNVYKILRDKGYLGSTAMLKTQSAAGKRSLSVQHPQKNNLPEANMLKTLIKVNKSNTSTLACTSMTNDDLLEIKDTNKDAPMAVQVF